jgi:enoyl-CoA hydratase/carnithine racemase
MAGMVLIRGLLRDDIARELTYTGRIFTGQGALALGLATHVSADPYKDALALAAEIAGRSPHAVRAAKRLFALLPEADQHTILKQETEEQVALIGTPNQVEAIRANMEKRTPKFADV